MQRVRNPLVSLTAAAIAAVITGCASGPTQKPPPSSDLAVGFAYKGIGVGPQALAGMIVLERGMESRVASRAIIDAVQSLQLAFREPASVGLDTLLPPGKSWTTDVLPIERASIVAYNESATPRMAIPADRLYGVQYIGVYAIVDRELRFNIAAKLFQRGAASAERPYSRDYSGDWFVAQLRDAIRAKLTAAAAPPPSP
jgi:hypothetical protein